MFSVRFLLSSLCLCISAVSVSPSPPSEKCTYSLEVLQIQDASTSFYNHIEKMAGITSQLAAALKENFGEVRYGISSFVDKPMPTRGIGNYGNMKAFGYGVDWCFKLHTPLGEDFDQMAKGLERLANGMGNGGDFPENPYEGILLAAYNKAVGWSAPEVTHSPSGRPLARLALLITDDIPHWPTDATNGANVAWHYPRSYADYDNSAGGFGSKVWGTIPNIIFKKTPQDVSDYDEMCDLFRIGDLGGTRTDSEEARLNGLIEKFGPYPWPTIVPHPGDDSMSCNVTEYPQVKQVVAALNQFRITPIVIVGNPNPVSKETQKHCTSRGQENDILDCLVQTYIHDFAQEGMTAIVKTLDSADIIQTIIDAIGDATNDLCLHPTAPPPSPPPQVPTTTTKTTTTPTTETTTTTTETTPTLTTSTTTTTESTSITPDTTETDATTSTPAEASTSASTGADADSDSSEETTTVDTTTQESDSDRVDTLPIDETTGASNGPTASAEVSDLVTSASMTGSTTSTTETTTTEKKKSNIAVIAGATGGAVAGAAGVAALLYKKIGMSMFGGGASPTTANITQVDVPESPVEREMLEEVSMDMFQ